MEPRTDLTPETFRPYVGDRFALPAAGELTLLLASLDESMTGAGAREGGAFSLHFQGPAEPLLAQATYHLTHESLGDLLLFLVPVGRTPEGGLGYEAAFN